MLNFFDFRDVRARERHERRWNRGERIIRIKFRPLGDGECEMGAESLSAALGNRERHFLADRSILSNQHWIDGDQFPFGTIGRDDNSPHITRFKSSDSRQTVGQQPPRS